MSPSGSSTSTSPQAIAEEFHLSLGEVYSALAYYYDHKEEIDRSIEETDQRAQEMARNYPHGWTPERDTVESHPARDVSV